MLRVAAVMSWVLGLGFGVPGLIGILYFAEHGQVWTFLGFPTYGDGPFETFGIHTTVLLLGSFLVVCLMELLSGWLLWRRRPAGAAVTLALTPVELVFWIGFALPFGLIVGLARTALIVAAGIPSRHRRDPTG